ncbi:MAG: hypothetical protein WA947_05390 [Phormidesmis sp.]
MRNQCEKGDAIAPPFKFENWLWNRHRRLDQKIHAEPKQQE